MTLHDAQQTPAGKTGLAETGATTKSLLGFESGGERWLVDLADVGEVLPVPILNEVPITKPWFRGIANIRGTLYGVTDFAAFHGSEPTPFRAQSRLLLAGARLGNCGSGVALLMASTLGLRVLASLEPVTAVAADSGQLWRGECYRDSDGNTWTQLRLSQLLVTTEFLDIAD
jgi:twitching motility protein PilI